MKAKKQKEQGATDRTVSPRRAHAPNERSLTSAVRKDFVPNTTSYGESRTQVEQIEEERQGVRRSPRTLASMPAQLVKKSAKPAATLLSVARKT